MGVSVHLVSKHPQVFAGEVLSLRATDRQDDVPKEIQTELFARLNEIAVTLDSLPRDNAMLESLAISVLAIDIKQWRFLYRLRLRQAVLSVERVLRL